MAEWVLRTRVGDHCPTWLVESCKEDLLRVSSGLSSIKDIEMEYIVNVYNFYQDLSYFFKTEQPF